MILRVIRLLIQARDTFDRYTLDTPSIQTHHNFASIRRDTSRDTSRDTKSKMSVIRRDTGRVLQRCESTDMIMIRRDTS